MGCDQKFGCHSCVSSLRLFIKLGEQALELDRLDEKVMAMKELKATVEMARIIAFSSENKEV